MATTTLPMPLAKNSVVAPYPVKNEASNSAVSWGAVTAGAFVSAALALSLLTLGAGAGLSSLSPWLDSGVSPSAVGMGAILWFVVVEIVAAGMGGYLTGRLRTKWVDVHSDEVYFRDTAHGFLSWAVAFVITAAILLSAATSIVSGERRGSAGSRSEGVVVDSSRYFVDSLFRSAQSANGADEALRAEVGTIFARDLRRRELTPEDKNYIADVVAAKTGLSRPDADKRVTESFAGDQQAADDARKTAAHSLYWLFVALLVGAFSASLAATFGGRQRDHIHA
jgi:hypothetical protein